MPSICRLSMKLKMAARPIADRLVILGDLPCIPVRFCPYACVICVIFSVVAEDFSSAAEAIDIAGGTCYNVHDNLITHCVADPAMNRVC